MIWFQYTDVLYPCERCCTMLTFHFPSFHHSPTSTPTLRTGTRSSLGSPRTSSRPPSTPAWYSTSFTLALISDRSLLSSDLLGKINLSELGQRPAGNGAWEGSHHLVFVWQANTNRIQTQKEMTRGQTMLCVPLARDDGSGSLRAGRAGFNACMLCCESL